MFSRSAHSCRNVARASNWCKSMALPQPGPNPQARTTKSQFSMQCITERTAKNYSNIVRLCGPVLSNNGARFLLHGYSIVILPAPPVCVSRRWQQTKAKADRKSRQIAERNVDDKSYGQLTFGEKVARTGKDVSYTGIVIGGLAVTAVMFYVIGRELFSTQSPSGVYSKALKRCRKYDEVIDNLGTPIKGYGEMSTRGRRRHVRHTEYEVQGVPHMRMKFYVEGPHRKGTVQLDVYKSDSGKYEYRYLLVELDGYPSQTIIIEDNR